MKKSDGLSYIIFLSLAAFAAFVWYEILTGRPNGMPRDYFLDVGQGDAELIAFTGNVRVMTDAGPDKAVLASLGKVLPLGDRYIDLAIVSHPQLDHFNGFNFILDQYKVGAFIINGRSDTKGIQEWPELLAKIKAENIPLITLEAGDSIRYGNNKIDLLSPNQAFDQSGELNDTGFVELIKTPGMRTLLTADIGFNVEDYLVQNHSDLEADVLKVPHHGSKYSSGDAFLRAVHPKIAVIEVGAHNSYGHPTKEALLRLASSSAKIFRTDQNGTIEVFVKNQKLEIFTGKK